MGATTDFWLLVHNLAEAMRQEGRSRQARLDALSESFEAMPQVTRRELSEEFRFLLAELNALGPVMSSKGTTPTSEESSARPAKKR
jgi:hypothetical protein